jgi:hypothetical protein
MRAYFSRRVIIVLVFALVNVLDVWTTHLGLAAGLTEGNPVTAMILASSGLWAWCCVKTLVAAGFLFIVLRFHHPCFAVYGFVAVLSLVVISNSLAVM